jgi:hypothetical protein
MPVFAVDLAVKEEAGEGASDVVRFAQLWLSIH